MNKSEFNALVDEATFDTPKAELIKEQYARSEKGQIILAIGIFLIFFAFTIFVGSLVKDYEQTLDNQEQSWKTLSRTLSKELCYMYGMPDRMRTERLEDGRTYITCLDSQGVSKTWKIPQKQNVG